MAITKEFLQAEIAALETEMARANAFAVKAAGVIEAYRMLVAKLDEPEPTDVASEAGDASSSGDVNG